MQMCPAVPGFTWVWGIHTQNLTSALPTDPFLVSMNFWLKTQLGDTARGKSP